MKFIIYFTVSFALFSSAAHAMNAPFVWPESYMFTEKITSKSKEKPVFFDAYRCDGLKARNESSNMDDKIFHDHPVAEIFRLDMHKRIAINADGSITETQLPADWPKSNIFPQTGIWETQGKDIIRGLPALKYKITRAPGHTVIKIPPSMQDPAHSEIKLPDTMRDPANLKVAPYITVWLSPDNKVPLRMEDGDDIVDFLNYSAGLQDPKYFEAEGK